MNHDETKALVAIIGAGGFGREVMPLVEATKPNLQDSRQERVFVVEDESASGVVNGYRLISKRQFLAHPGPRLFNVAISDAHTRRRIAEELLTAGCEPLSLVSPISDNQGHTKIGEGAIVCAYCTIMINATIGRFFHCNLYSTVSHDVVIGDYVTFAPRVACNGGVVVEDDVYIGTGAIVRHALPDRPIVIGRGAVVGMGAVVTKSVPPGATVVGNPARVRC